MSLESMGAMVGRMDEGREAVSRAQERAPGGGRRRAPRGRRGAATGGVPRPAGCCPRCGCGRVRGHGRDARGRRRWVCLGCGRAFGASTGTVLGCSRLDRVTWHAYAGAMLAGASLRACASVAGVSLRTSFFMRYGSARSWRARRRPSGRGCGAGCSSTASRSPTPPRATTPARRRASRCRTRRAGAGATG